MKNIVILISFMFITLTSCNLNNNPPFEEPEDPKAKGFYECFINGEPYRANGPGSNQFSPNPHFSLTELGGTLAFRIFKDNDYQVLSLYTIGVDDVGIYKPHSSAYFAREINGIYTIYNLLESEFHEIEITKFDSEFDIIVGTYELSYVNVELADTLRVHGAFDVHYTL